MISATCVKNTLRAELAIEDLKQVSPVLANYMQTTIVDDLWKRAGLSPSERGVVTVAALVARSQTIDIARHFNAAFDNGVTPAAGV